MFVMRVLWKVGVKKIAFLAHLFGTNNVKFDLEQNTVVSMDNFVECSRWNVLTGPNDERMGPRFVPMTHPMDQQQEFLQMAESEPFDVKIPKVLTAHAPNWNLISRLARHYHASLGQQTIVTGLIPMIQVAQHVGLKKMCLGVIDYDSAERLANVPSFDLLLQMFEIYFAQH